MKRILYALHLEGQPTAVACDVGQELAFVRARTETRQSHSALFQSAICSTLIDIGGSEERFHDVHLSATHSIQLIYIEHTVLTEAQTIVFADLPR